MSIDEEIAAQARGFSGQFGLWAYCPDTGETISYAADRPYPSASTLKLMILYTVWAQAALGRLSLEEPLAVQSEDLVSGSGILKELTPGGSLSVRDLATLMIVISDNTASNVLIDRVGLSTINATCGELGLNDTRLYNRFMRYVAGNPLNSTSPADLGSLLLRVAEHQVLTPTACDEMLDILQRQHFRDYLTRRIPAFFSDNPPSLAAKDGTIEGVRNAVGYVRAADRRYVVAIMSEGCTDLRYHVDNEGALLSAELSAAVFRHFVAM